MRLVWNKEFVHMCLECYGHYTGVCPLGVAYEFRSFYHTTSSHIFSVSLYGCIYLCICMSPHVPPSICTEHLKKRSIPILQSFEGVLAILLIRKKIKW